VRVRSDGTGVRRNVDAEAPDPGVSAPDVERRCPDRNNGLAETGSVHSRIQGEDSDVRSKHSRLRIGKLEILDIAASPGPGTERLGPRTDVRAEDIDKLNLRRHQRVESFRIPVLPRIPDRLFAAQHCVGAGIMAGWQTPLRSCPQFAWVALPD
jgi:hypothetical protein